MRGSAALRPRAGNRGAIDAPLARGSSALHLPHWRMRRVHHDAGTRAAERIQPAAAAARDYAVLTRRRALMEFGRTTSSPDGLSIAWTGFPMGAVATRWSIARQAPSPMRTGAGQTVLPTNATTPRMSTSLLASTVRSEQRPLSASK